MSHSDMPTVSISLTVKDGHAALDFYKNAFGIEETFRMDDPGGGLAHSEFKLGNTHMFMSEASEEWGAFPMAEGTTSSCIFSVMTESCDDAYAKAIAAGATSISEPADQFWGMRSCVVRDPFGYRWSMAQIIEHLTPEQVQERAAKLFGAA